MLDVAVSPPTSSLRVGEIVGTSAGSFEAQSPRLHEAPALGTLVRVQADSTMAIYGVVAGSGTDGVDTGARPVPRGRDGCEDEEIYREHPDLSYVLRTCFQCVVVGFSHDGQTYHYLPPLAAPIHYSVIVCSADEALTFTGRMDYFRMLLDARNVPTEEILAAHIRYVADRLERSPAADGRPRGFAVRAGREVASILRGDHQRLMKVLERIRPLALAAPSPMSA